MNATIRDVMEFSKEFERMCAAHPNCDIKCPFNRNCPSLKTVTEEHVEILSKWVSENPAPIYVITFNYKDVREMDEACGEIVGATTDMYKAQQLFDEAIISARARFADFDCYEENSEKYEAWKSEDAGSFYFTVEINKLIGG